jgi:hypothetical protein
MGTDKQMYAIRGFFTILAAELVRSFIIMRRYWFAALIGLVMGYGTLVAIVFGLMYTPDSVKVYAAGVSDKILGFLIGVFAFGIIGLFTQGIMGMARTGELEQVCLSPFGLVNNFMARSFVAAVNSIISSAVMLGLIAWTVSESLHFAPATTILLLALTYVNLIGFGFMVGGLVLIFKNVGQIAVIVRFAMLGLAIFATERIVEWPTALRWFAHAMPVTDAAICLKYTLVQGQMIMAPVLNASGQIAINEAGPIFQPVFRSVFFHPSFAFLLISCVFWTAVGVACFRYMEDWSRDKGTLGAY